MKRINLTDGKYIIDGDHNVVLHDGVAEKSPPAEFTPFRVVYSSFIHLLTDQENSDGSELINLNRTDLIRIALYISRDPAK
jgi:hypothetical protein